MPPILRPPNRLEILGFPVFSMSWYADPADGTSILAYAGGGGSARTGVGNKVGVVVNTDDNNDDEQAEPVVLSTGTAVGIAIHIYATPTTTTTIQKQQQKQKLWMLLSLEHQVQRYSLPDCTLQGTLSMRRRNSNNDSGSTCSSGCNCIAVNAMADRLALGCEDGSVQVYALLSDADADADDTNNNNNKKNSDRLFTSRAPLFVCQKHENAVCAVNFAQRGDRLLSCAKDGTACVWKASDGSFINQVKCDVSDPTTKRQQRPTAKRQQRLTQVMVRGCAFGDLEGKLFYTVASARRGKAFLSRWIEGSGEQTGTYQCQDRLAVSDFPISSMSLSQDGGLLVLGSVDGNAILWSTSQWKALKVFKEVHGLPLTCVAPRPYPVPLQGEEDGVVIHARTASADGTLASLTLQKHVPKTAGVSGNGWGIMKSMHYTMLTVLFFWILFLIMREAADTCEINGFGELLRARRCLIEDFLIAPASRPGISVPPF